MSGHVPEVDQSQHVVSSSSSSRDESQKAENKNRKARRIDADQCKIYCILIDCKSKRSGERDRLEDFYNDDQQFDGW